MIDSPLPSGSAWVGALAAATNPVLPPAQAEAMYYPEIKAGTDLGAMSVEGGQ